MDQIKSGRKTPVKLPYTFWAGRNDVKSAPKDKFGNPNGSNYDLLRDGSMVGYSILIINLCDAPDLCGQEKNYADMKQALRSKGFDVVYTSTFPYNFPQQSSRYCQVWLISGSKQRITNDQITQLIRYYESGHGLYLWADNTPFINDINPILGRLFGSSINGNYSGDQVIGVQKNTYDSGIVAGHLISTGILNFYEGITISNVQMTQSLRPLVYSSDKKVVTAYSDAGGKRILVDGGFTRLCYKWNTAGTARYVVNAAGWLGNFERFGWNIPK